MHNFLTRQVESYLGSIYILMLAAFFVGLFFIAIQNFNSDSEILNSSTVQVRSISQTERELIKEWLQANELSVPEGKGYRYIIQEYPSKPWLQND